MCPVALQNGGAVLGRVGAEGGGSSLANLDHFSPQIRDFSHLHQPQLESLSPNYSSPFISQILKHILNYESSSWAQRIILDVSHPDPTKIH